MPVDTPPKPRILIAVDLSPASRRALEAGAELARDLGAEVLLLHVTGAANPASFQGLPPIGAPGLDPSHPKPESGYEGVMMHATAAEWASWASNEGVKVTALERQGKAVETIVREAEQSNCLLVVVGHSAARGIKSALMGSVAKGLVNHCRRPVLVVPYEAAPGRGPSVMPIEEVERRGRRATRTRMSGLRR